MAILKFSLLTICLLAFTNCSLFSKKDKTIRVQRFDKNLTEQVLKGGDKSIDYDKCPDDYKSLGSECILKSLAKKTISYKREYITTYSDGKGHHVELNLCKNGFAPYGSLCSTSDDLERFDREISQYRGKAGHFKYSYSKCPKTHLALGAECILKKKIYSIVKYKRAKDSVVEGKLVVDKFDRCEGGFIPSNDSCVRVK